MRRFHPMIILGTGLLLGCAVPTRTVTAGRPHWMENEHPRYPFSQYLTAMGEGDTAAAAEAVALGNLAKIFRTEITVDERLEERYFELIGERNLYQEQTQFGRDVTLRSSLSLMNVQFPERYTDRGTGRVHVLAVLHRAGTAAIYVTRLNENDGRTARFVERSESPSAAMRYAALSAAVAVSTGSQLLLEQLDVLMPAAKAKVALSYDHDDLKVRMAEAVKAIGFQVAIENDDQGKITQAVVSLLTERGFTITPDDAFLQVTGRVEMEDTDMGRQGLHFVRYQLHIDVHAADGKTVLALNEHGREGHVSRKEALNRCVRSMTGAIDRNLAFRVWQYFDSMVNQ